MRVNTLSIEKSMYAYLRINVLPDQFISNVTNIIQARPLQRAIIPLRALYVLVQCIVPVPVYHRYHSISA
jgi:hypothetical protein